MLYRMGWLAAVLGLGAACNGQMGSSAENKGGSTNGAKGGAAGVTGGKTASTGGDDVSTGGTHASAGGSSSTTGDTHASAGASSPSTGGAIASAGTSSPSTGGAIASAGASSSTTAGSGASGGSSMGANGGRSALPPYIVDPKLPIDPACTCASSDEVCNERNQCVPRCDALGHCARWLANHAVKDLFLQGSSLYFTVAPKTDSLGNPGTDGSLYRVKTPDGTPTLIADGLGSPSAIFGRHRDATFLRMYKDSAYSIVEVDDSGKAAVLVPGTFDARMWGHWVVYADSTGSKLLAIDLDGTRQPVVLVDGSAGASNSSTVHAQLILGDTGTVLYTYGDQTCTMQLSNLAAPPTCGRIDTSRCYWWAGDTTREKFYCNNFGVNVFAYTPAAVGLTLYSGSISGYQPEKILFANDWLYIVTTKLTPVESKQLVRVPVLVGRLPQQVIPEQLVTRHIHLSAEMLFAVSATDVYWVQDMIPVNDAQAQYIFSAPLPPQPCDDELPCTDSTQSCINASCSSAQ